MSFPSHICVHLCPSVVSVRVFLLAVLFLTSSVSGQEPLRITADGFAVPQAGQRFTFPRDHGSHPEFKIEWWYVTGHLMATNGRRFGYQATFFRRAAPLLAATNAPNDQLYLAHMALLDAKTGRFLHQERINRRGWDAEATTNRMEVFNGPWRLRMTNVTTEAMELFGGVRAEASFQLRLVPSKPLVVFGTNGLSRKGADPTAASHYLTFTRLQTSGELRLGTETIPVTGESWMDHEISSSQLEDGQAGWDWTAIQLHDGTELMVYVLRRKDGTIDRFSTLAHIDREGRVRQIGPDRFTWEPTGTWHSPDTGAVYPAGIRLNLPEGFAPATTLTLSPLAAKQELTGSLGGIAYWEGACRVLDGAGREIGSAFLELTGYSGSLADQMQ